MKRYIFFLIAFFLSLSSVYAMNMGNAVNATPTPVGRNANELGNISESTQKSNQPISNTQKVKNDLVKRKTSSLSTVSCKTYQGKDYKQGEAGYDDCIRTIKNTRQEVKNVP